MTSPSPPWQRTQAEVLEELGVVPQEGLSDDEATARRARFGPNALREAPAPGLVRRFFAQLGDVTVLALLVASAVAALIGALEESDRGVERYTDAIAILAIVLLNAVIGIVQEGRARSALQALQNLESPTATLLRDGKEQSLPAHQLVPGDVVLLREGDRVPADARLVQAGELSLGEAALTGESVAVRKEADTVLAADTPLAERRNMVFQSTLVQSGTATCVVTSTGADTELGRVARLLDDVRGESTPLERQMRIFGTRVVVGCAILSVLVFGVGLLRLDAPIGFTLLLAVSLAVAAIPEGLPAVTTIVLALGVRTMATKRSIVRKLSAVEALGSVHVICSDKTGTLTENRMTVRRVFVDGDEFEPEASELTQPSRSRLVQAARFAPLAHVATSDRDSQVVGEPTDVALLEFHRRFAKDAPKGRIQGGVPFSSERKRSSVVFEDTHGELTLYCHGAPEVLVERSRSWFVGDAEAPLDDAARRDVDQVIQRWTSSGFRVLAVAERPVSGEELIDESLEQELVLIGLLALSDPPREGVAEAVALARRGGVRTIMITGDHPTTARAIATELGILRPEGEVLHSRELQAMSEEELSRKIDRVDVIARATPQDKLLVIRAFQKRGIAAAMTGDGVNDAPAIKAATIGIAMGKGGTDAAREVADLVLADDNYATIVSAIEHGRAIYANIQRFVGFLFAANLALVMLVCLGLALGWPSLLTPTQILWINLVTNGLPALALGMEPKTSRVMDSPPREQGAGLLSARAWWSIAVSGAWLASLGLWVFDWAGESHGLTHARTMTFAVLALGPLFYAFSARSDRAIWQLSPFGNHMLWLAFGSSFALQLVALYLPQLSIVFQTAGLTLEEFAIALALAASVLLPAEMVKALHRLRATASRERRFEGG